MIRPKAFQPLPASNHFTTDKRESPDELLKGADRAAELIPLSKARDFIPGRPHIATITRWRLTGILDAKGERVKLRTTRVGGRHMISLADIGAFLAKLNADAAADDPESEEDVARHNRETRQALAALGVGSAVER